MRDPAWLAVVAGWLVLCVLVGLWANRWNRGSVIGWAALTFFLTPFGFWMAVLVLLLRGPKPR